MVRSAFQRAADAAAGRARALMVMSPYGRGSPCCSDGGASWPTLADVTPSALSKRTQASQARGKTHRKLVSGIKNKSVTSQELAMNCNKKCRMWHFPPLIFNKKFQYVTLCVNKSTNDAMQKVIEWFLGSGGSCNLGKQLHHIHLVWIWLTAWSLLKQWV